MTCVIAMRDRGSIHMASDRGVHLNGALRPEPACKMKRFSSGLIVGFAGQMLSSFTVSNDSDAFDRCILSDKGALSALLEHVSYTAVGPIEMLMARGNDLVYMSNEKWDILRVDVWGIGMGGYVAMGSCHERADLLPRGRLERAIEVSSSYLPTMVSQEYDYDHT